MSSKKKPEQYAYLTIGLPGSGKTTWAKEFVRNNPSFVRVNNDDIRTELFGDNFEWKPALEKQVKAHKLSRMADALRDEKSIIVDNTHLNHKTLVQVESWIKQQFPNVIVVHQEFTNVPVHVCIDRDGLRQRAGERFVGAEVILKMAREADLLPKNPENPIDWELPWAMISDLDGTLAIFDNRRNPYDASMCHLVDVPNLAVLNTLRTYEGAHKNSDSEGVADPNVVKIFFFSGRTDKYKPQTIQFLLEKCGFDVVNDPFFELVMRQQGDSRADEIIKREMYDAYIIGKYNVHAVFDDRPRVCRLWRSLGLPVFNVGEGVEF